MTTTLQKDVLRNIADHLIKQAWTLATAESCTGGGVAQAVTSLPGSSKWFERGFVTYSNLAKQDMLGVPPDTIAHYGAVSEETARAMAKGALLHGMAQASLAVTGIAGPTGGTPDKPVGTVCFAWAIKDRVMHVSTMHFDGDRSAVQAQSIDYILRTLLHELENL